MKRAAVFDIVIFSYPSPYLVGIRGGSLGLHFGQCGLFRRRRLFQRGPYSSKAGNSEGRKGTPRTLTTCAKNIETAVVGVIPSSSKTCVASFTKRGWMRMRSCSFMHQMCRPTGLVKGTLQQTLHRPRAALRTRLRVALPYGRWALRTPSKIAASSSGDS
jgi:hypothetical protein